MLSFFMCILITKESILQLTNFDREAFGRPPLVENAQLDEAAQNKADDMYMYNYWAHNSPDGRTPWNFISEVGYNYQEAGENLAEDFDDAGLEELAWMNSPEHRSNILNPDFEDIGIGIKLNKVVVEFGMPVKN